MMSWVADLVHSGNVWVIINKKRHKINGCTYSDDEFCLKYARNRSLQLKHDDIVLSEVHGSKGTGNYRVIWDAYPLIKERRQLVQIILICDCEVAEHLEGQISMKIEEQRSAPHHPTKTLLNHRILVIVNPFSGRKRAIELWKKHVIPILQVAKVDYDLISTGHERHAVEIAKDLELDKYDAVAVVSGDGLILEVISGFLLRKDRERALKMPLAHIPGGTSNGLAASICFQCNEPFSPRGVFCTEMTLMVVRPRYLPLRISHAQTEHDGDKAMFMSLTWGLIADIDIGSERFRWAGMARLHMEAFIRVAQLPKVAHYKARISYLPVPDSASKCSANLRNDLQRRKYSEGHFVYAPVEHFCSTDSEQEEPSSSDIFEDADLVKMPALSEPVDSDWVVIEGYFVYVCVTSLSHLGSDVPYLPCARLDDEFLYLTYTDWNGVKSRFEFAKMMLGMDDCSHLTYPFLQIIPVRACRVEPMDHCGGYAAVDGEQITSGSAFQVVPTKYCATVIGRNERR